MIISAKVGEKIDAQERNYYRIFTSIQHFQSAKFYYSQTEHAYAVIETQPESGAEQTVIQEYPLNVIFRMAEKINNYDDILANKFLSGEDITKIEVQGGPTLSWVPEFHKKVIDESKNISEKTDSIIDEKILQSDDSGFSPIFEIQVFGGYGFSNGAPPVRSYNYEMNDITTPSIEKITNAKDNYNSVGSGKRIGLQMNMFITNTFGLFLAGEYAFSQYDLKITSKNIFMAGVPMILTGEQKSTVKFSTTNINFGMIYRFTNYTVNPYFGIGSGIWLAPKINELSTEIFNVTKVEKERQMSANSTIGFSSFIGINCSLSSTIKIFFEGKASFVTYYVKSIEMKKYKLNDNDITNTLSESGRKIIFEENKNYTKTIPANPNEPFFGGPPQPIPANSLSVIAGLMIEL
ncbi:MAG: hypothetical protein H3C35_07500 [Bacteroidetes bacterium]|nr:hypothetical protein [Bacteroidota bacterium]